MHKTSSFFMIPIKIPTYQYTNTAARCLDTYIDIRTKSPREDTTETIDPRLTSIIERLFDRCLQDGQHKQAIGIALESRRLDRLESAVLSSPDPADTLRYALNIARTVIVSRSFRDKVLRLLVSLYERTAQPDYTAIFACLTALNDVDEASAVLFQLLNGSEDDVLMAYQIGFDVVEAELQSFISTIRDRLKEERAKIDTQQSRGGDGMDVEQDDTTLAPADGGGDAAPVAADASRDDSTAVASSHMANLNPVLARYARFDSIVSGDVPIELERQFLARRNATDLQILKNMKAGVEPRNSVCHGATIFANAIMHAGTTVDTFLRENLDWLAKATNWAKFSATAGLGVIHRGNISNSRSVMSPYLPSAPGGASGSPYSEGGALYALGLIHVNRGPDIRSLLLESLRGTQHEVIQHGACLGLGIAGLGSEDTEAFEEIKNVLYLDNAIAGEAAGLALGLLFAGTGTERSAEMLAYAHDTQHEKIIRGLAIGLAAIHFGREEAAETTIEGMIHESDPILRYGGMFAIALAYVGTSNNSAVQRLLHHAVSDVSNDVRRAAVMCIGFVLANAPEQCPRIVALLAESYNPHVRYGAAMAVGIAAAGTGNRDAIAMLEPMLKDSADFVQQGVLIASSLILVEQPESRQKALRSRIDSLHGTRGAELMTRMGAIMAAGILDSGGRNITVGLRSESGNFKRTAVVGLAVFLQYWYWYPLSHTLSLSLRPTALIGVDATLCAPKDFECQCECKPSMFAYPVAVSVEDKKAKEKLPAAVLSTTARAKARAAKKEKKDGTDSAQDMETAEGNEKKDGEQDAGNNKAEPEATSFTLTNPARVVPGQRKFVRFVDGSRWKAVRPMPSGFVVLKNEKPDEDVEYLFQEEKKAGEGQQKDGGEAAVPASGGANDEGDEPPPPEPFEYVPS